MEVFERMAWYGFYAVSSLYITSPASEGGLGFSSVQRGILQGVVPFLLYLFPVITGALADRYGYKRAFLVAFSIMTPAYLLMGQFKSFWLFFAAFLLVALGASVFKPVVVGTVGRTTDETNRGLGFGVFYTIVNIGGFFGPIVAGAVRAISWDMVFLMSAFWIALNFIPTLFMYQEPTKSDGEGEKRSLLQVLAGAQEILGNGRFALVVIPILLMVMLSGGEWVSWGITLSFSLGWLLLNWGWNAVLPKEDAGRSWLAQRARIGNWPFVLYLLILSGFWASFNQIFITMPEFIRDFVDTSDLVSMVSVFGTGTVDFLASVKVDSLATWLGDAVTQHGAIALGDQSRELFFQAVHFKVRVPEAELVSEMSRLAAMGTPSAEAVHAVAERWAGSYRQVNPEYIINLDAGAIIVFQILVSTVIDRWKPFPVLVVGTLVAGAGIAMGSVALTGVLVVVAIVVFAFGEMIASPKSQEYVARIAPSDKVALFMGYYFVSIALGNLFGGILSGWGYQVLAKDMNMPGVMWLIFGGIGFLTAAALLLFNTRVVPLLEAQHAANNDGSAE
ncbi:MAG: MFS transporter [Deltaproteobacteria bacterium]|nr:MFS transporter [Deltaproteobacteria bacterium]